MGRRGRPRSVDDAGHLGPAAVHQRPDALPDRPSGRSRGEPHGHLRADVRAAGRLAGRPRGAPRRGGGERAHRAGQRRRGRRLEGFAARRGVRHLERRPDGCQHRPAHGRQVVRRVVHRRPGPVVARRPAAIRVRVSDAADLSGRRPGDRRPGRRSDDRHARARRPRRVRGWRRPGRLAGRGVARGRGRGLPRLARVARSPRGATRARATVVVPPGLASEWHAIRRRAGSRLGGDVRLAGRADARAGLVARRRPGRHAVVGRDAPVSGA